MPLQVAHALTESQIDQLCELYERQWWSGGRTRAEVDTMLAHCAIAALVDDADGTLVGFARAVTDGVFTALVLDVIVTESRRGEHLGQRVMEALHAHPSLQNVRHFELYCRADMDGFYARFGYTSALGDLQLMRYSRRS